jgi:hypothetical protein
MPSELGTIKVVYSTYNDLPIDQNHRANERIHNQAIFITKLRADNSKDEASIEKQANYLLLAKHGLAAASRLNNTKEIEDYIELTFRKI